MSEPQTSAFNVKFLSVWYVGRSIRCSQLSQSLVLCTVAATTHTCSFIKQVVRPHLNDADRERGKERPVRPHLNDADREREGKSDQ